MEKIDRSGEQSQRITVGIFLRHSHSAIYMDNFENIVRDKTALQQSNFESSVENILLCSDMCELAA